jgi:colanic acid/amylovoran biosynthesis glycosyltransferase
MKGTVAYLMPRFPYLSETFILREMVELERQGYDIVSYPLMVKRQALSHPEAELWLKNVRKTPWVSWDVVIANLRTLFKRPGLYLSLLGQILQKSVANPKILIRSVAVFPKAFFMAERFMADGIDHVHAHYATLPSLVAWVINKLTGISYSMTVHAHDIFVDRTMLKEKLEDATFVIAISRFNQDFLAHEVGAWIKAKTHVVHCGVDMPMYSARDWTRPFGNPFEIISVGGLHLYKGYVYLVRACSVLKENGVRFHCRIVGEGAQRSILEQTIQQLDLNGTVELLGAKQQQEVAALLPTADCYVQPSVITPSGKMEGIPVALMEAMASALPVIGTNISGIPELVKDGETGWLVSPRDVEELAEALEEVFANKDEAFKRAEAGRSLVLSEFNLSVNVAKLGSFFAQAVGALAT